MTSLTIEQTGEVIEQMTTVEAERITARIADKLDAIADNLEQVLPLIGEALTRRAWEALGYASPTAYVSERFAGALTRLSPEVRRPVVAQLSDAGMSTRAIAPIVGKSPRQVAYDREAGVQSLHTSPDPEAPTFDPTPDWDPTPMPSSDRITGMDGKTYQRPAPVTVDHDTGEIAQTKPNRKPITDTARDIGLDLNAITDRIDRLMNDDRFDRNRDDIAARLRHHIATATTTLNTLNSKIN